MGDDPSPFDELPELPEQFAPGEQTRAVIMNAGIHRRTTRNRQIAILIGGILMLCVSIIALDAAGIVQLLPEKMVPTLIGKEPKEEPEREAPQPKAEELRDTLLGKTERAPAPASPAPTQAEPSAPKDLTARSLFEDYEKKPSTLELSARAVRTEVALPDGLTGEAITQVIQDNSGGARLCIAEAMKAGETKGGKAEFDVTIANTGSVNS
ncbi:MAG: hypothetical protein AAFY60_14935, partial [Myxococcota bacterium]